ncbi:MAG: hypothetical protein ACC645_21620 [Pirellulales bacterium]
MTGLLTRFAMPIATVLLILGFRFTGVPQRCAAELQDAYYQTTYEVNRSILELEWRIKHGMWF